MNNNDFSEVLRDFINTLNLPLTCTLDYLSEKESLVIYPLPGGKIEKEYMNGKQDISLVYEVAIKTTDHQKTSSILWAINYALADFSLELPSQNNSYQFRSLEVSQPFLNDRDDQGFYVYMLDVTARLETNGGK
ncbi:TPA: minor capsid protein [Streptococcus pyogenes]|uniref:minor capsid protein n=1 Tax=Streptococcus TaxID=1301 RepID=UPI0021F83E59|nr:minor capsid protein [Streptococcus anginosus]HEP5229939.1 minor capsid protein [Streptococcus pyogenes]MCW0950258.1 minor capsid protein [Streptococcus anginosus]MCW0963843.1 minor capsid protein [Streptococcus anginosus]HEQ9431473.1 minor capsid protein [Streptococcus pyogenes]HER2973560.1 minor capsid protein [Streptococcus pyogenes]